MSLVPPDRGQFWTALAVLVSVTGIALVAAVSAPGLARSLRIWFAFAPGERQEGVEQALATWHANGRVVCLLLLAALGTRERLLVPVLDLLVGVCVAANVALVGLALGAYGPSLLLSLVHVPLEWAALAVALAVFLDARRHAPPRPLALAKAGALAAVLLAFAAAVETWATPLP